MGKQSDSSLSLPESSFRKPSSSTRSKLITALAGVSLLLAVSSFSVGQFSHNKSTTNSFTSSGSLCFQPSPPAKPSNYSAIYDTQDFIDLAAQRFLGAIRIPTQSFDDMGTIQDDPRWEPFADLHAYLRKTFPLVYKNFEFELVGGYSPIYTLKGSNDELKPIMLTGHLDVVPATTVLDRWEFPPFKGVLDADGWIHGRGSSDCKNNVVGLLAAAENLIASGFSPKRTIVFAFGQDEEAVGRYGAVNIAKVIEKRYGINGVALLIDEGGMGLESIYGRTFALPSTGEKGSANFKITVDMLGGHSSVPSAHTSVGILSKLVSAVEDADLFKPTLESSSPIYGYLECLAAWSDAKLLPGWLRDGMSSQGQKDEKERMQNLADSFAELSLPNRFLIQTSKAATIFHGGVKVNALPETASSTFNSRIESFSTVSSTFSSYLSVLEPIAAKYSLLINGVSYTSDLPSTGNITLEIVGGQGLEASPISPLQSEAWELMKRSVQASFGPEVVTASTGMTGNTDTRLYWNLSKNIYRWSPTPAGTRLNLHTVGEKLKLSAHIGSIRFYTELIVAADQVQSDDGF